MWHSKNGVKPRKNDPNLPILTYNTTKLTQRARMCAMAVCLTTTWLVMSGVRYIFECDLNLVPADTELFQHLYNNSNDDGIPTPGERLMMRNWGCSMLAKGLIDLCVTFGGSPKVTFNILISFNILVAWSLIASMLEGTVPIGCHSETIAMVLLIVEAPCLYVLGGTNGVAEDDDDDHED